VTTQRQMAMDSTGVWHVAVLMEMGRRPAREDVVAALKRDTSFFRKLRKTPLYLALTGGAPAAGRLDRFRKQLTAAPGGGREVALALRRLGVFEADSLASFSLAAATLDSSLRVLEAARRATTSPSTLDSIGRDLEGVARDLASALERDQRETGLGIDRESFWLMAAAREWGRTRELVTRLGGVVQRQLASDLTVQAQRLASSYDRKGLAVIAYVVDESSVSWMLQTASGRFVGTSTMSDLAQVVAGLRREMGVERNPFEALGLEAGTPAPASVAMRTVAIGTGHRAFDRESCTAVMSTAPGSNASTDSSRTRGVTISAAESAQTRDNLAALTAALLPCPVARQLALDSIAEIVIVPGGKLALVPFAALPMPDGDMLGARYRLRYAPSLSVLAALDQPTSSVAPGAALVIGNPVMPYVRVGATRTQLARLPGSQKEAAVVAAILGAHPLYGSAATETAVKARLASASTIHIASHGFAYGDPRKSRESFVALAPDAQNDGLLTMAEVLAGTSPMRANLVVLSACETGLGGIAPGEGVVGLPWAFLARGARAVIVSLWSVDDEATSMLMQRFYEHRKTSTNSEALRLAQLDVRAKYPDARRWAAFQLVGGE
jgi:CHAT domain-containing protein